MTTDIYDLLKDDYEVFDAVETVTLTPATGSPDTSVSALRVMSPHRQQGGSVEWGGGAGDEVITQLFVVWTDTFANLVIHDGMTLTDIDSVEWVVQSHKEVTFRTRWRLVCQKGK